MGKDEALIKIGADRQAEALGYPAAARKLIVTNDEELKAVDEFVKGGKALQKEIRAGYDDIINDWHKGWKNSIAKRDHYLKPVAEGVDIAKGKMTPYLVEKARIRREAEEAARKAKAEAEAAARRAQEEAEAAARAAEEERQRKAREALHDGEKKKAEKILEEETKVFIPEVEDVPAPEEIIIPEKPKLDGTFTRTDWMWELKNIDLVPRVLPNGDRPLTLDRGVITKHVDKYKATAKIPGIRVFPKTIVISKGG